MEEVAGTGSLNNLRVLRLISGEVVPVFLLAGCGGEGGEDFRALRL
jgi:hypothetical protein